MKEGQIKAGIFNAAVALAKTGDPCHVDRIRELVTLLENRPSLKYKVASHAVKRFMERSKCKSSSAAEVTLKSMVDRAQELELKDRYKALQLINHDYKNARYLKFADWLLVVCGDTVVTCHHATAKRWKKLNSQVALAEENEE